MDWTKLIIAAVPLLLSNLPTLLNGSHPPGQTPPAGANPQTDKQRQFIAFIQNALNAAQSSGMISFGDPLVADGFAGPRTMAAATAVLSKLGVHVQA